MLGHLLDRDAVRGADPNGGPLFVHSTRLTEEIRQRWVGVRSSGVPDSAYWFRPSRAHQLCPRMYGLAAARQIVIKEELDAEDLWILEIGHAYHEMFQREILATLPPGVFHGRWEREKPAKNDTGAIVMERQPPEGDAALWIPRPEGEGWRYVEPEAAFAGWRMRGHCDGVLVWSPTDIEVLEIKTIRAEMVDRVDPKQGGKPLPAHLRQAHCYMVLFGVNRARIVYVLKTAPSMKAALIEWEVRRDETLIGVIGAELAACDSVLAQVYAARSAGVDQAELEKLVPERLPECTKRSVGRPLKCPLRDACLPSTRKPKESKNGKTSEKKDDSATASTENDASGGQAPAQTPVAS